MKLSKILLGTISVLFFALPGGGDAYFEHTYRCVIEESSIQVSLTTGDQLCFDYMAGLTNLLKQTSADITTAAENAANTEGYDNTYRVQILQQLTEKRDALTSVQQQIEIAMSDFEQELFVRVKGIVGYYLLSYTSSLEKKISQGKGLLVRLTIVGNKEQFAFVRKQIDQWEREMIFLERIKVSSDFTALIPPLKWRIQLQESRM